MAMWGKCGELLVVVAPEVPESICRLGKTEVVPSRCDHLRTLDLAVAGRFSEGRPCRKN
jgi:hypothetical protein